MPSMVSTRWAGMTPAGGKLRWRQREGGVPAQVIDRASPRARPRRTRRCPPPRGRPRTTGRPAACGHGRRAQKARTPHTAASGSAASNTATRSAMMTQVSITAIAAGVYQRRGARSSTMKMTSRGTWVPMWSGCWISRCDAVAELRGEQDPGRYQRTDHAFPPCRPPLGQQAGQQHQQRVGSGGRHVDHVRAEAPDQLYEHVLGQLGGVVRHVPDGPAAQQPVAVQHVPRLQRLVRAVRAVGDGARQP